MTQVTNTLIESMSEENRTTLKEASIELAFLSAKINNIYEKLDKSSEKNIRREEFFVKHFSDYYFHRLHIFALFKDDFMQIETDVCKIVEKLYIANIDPEKIKNIICDQVFKFVKMYPEYFSHTMQTKSIIVTKHKNLSDDVIIKNITNYNGFSLFQNFEDFVECKNYHIDSVKKMVQQKCDEALKQIDNLKNALPNESLVHECRCTKIDKRMSRLNIRFNENEMYFRESMENDLCIDYFHKLMKFLMKNTKDNVVKIEFTKSDMDRLLTLSLAKARDVFQNVRGKLRKQFRDAGYNFDGDNDEKLDEKGNKKMVWVCSECKKRFKELDCSDSVNSDDTKESEESDEDSEESEKEDHDEDSEGSEKEDHDEDSEEEDDGLDENGECTCCSCNIRRNDLLCDCKKTEPDSGKIEVYVLNAHF
jgi:hypothetical protein